MCVCLSVSLYGFVPVLSVGVLVCKCVCLCVCELLCLSVFVPFISCVCVSV